MADYDVAGALHRIENELIASMMRNLERHTAEEDDLEINWEQWQVRQLKALDDYKKRNRKIYGTQFKDINRQIENLIEMQRETGNGEQEIKILNAIKNGAALKKATGRAAEASAAFFRSNDRRLNALIDATTNDLQKAEHAMLRMADDKYRKIIFDAQFYAASGAGTYEKAIDMATKDFLRAGINCIEYKNGARHTAADYAEMAIRTAGKRSKLMGEGEMRNEYGIHTVIMNKRGNPCPKCLPFVGKVLIDDVWSGGSATDGKYPLMSSAIAAGLYHPRCKDGHTTYFPDIDEEPDDKFTKQELQDIEEQNRKEAKQQYAKRKMESFDRLARYSLDNDNKKMYEVRRDEWRNVHFKTGGVDNEAYLNEKREEKYYGKPLDVTKTWLSGTKKPGTVLDMLEYEVDGQLFKVDGKYVILDYSEAEKNIAELLQRELGGEIHMVPRVVYPEGISTPDYMFRGAKYDLKSLSGVSKNVIYNAISKKRRQSDNFILDFTQCALSDEELFKQIDDIYWSKHTNFVDTIITVRDGKILKVFTRNNK